MQRFEAQTDFSSVEALLSVYKSLDAKTEPAALQVILPFSQGEKKTYPDPAEAARATFNFAVEMMMRAFVTGQSRVRVEVVRT